MGRYIRKRLLQAVPVVFGITILTFFIMKMAPGGPLTGMISPRTSSESLQRAREALGLNDPIIVQYWNWLKQLVQGNFGYSTYNGQAVLTEILDRLPATLLLTVTSFVISFVVGIPLGVYSATHKYSKADYGLTVFSFIGISIPSFFFGMGLIFVFALKLKWLPTSVLNIIYNTVRYKADRIQGTLLVNPATVPCFADIIIMFIQKSL